MTMSSDQNNKVDDDTRLVLVTGLSGAGKSTALNQFEDLGWEVADNIPLSLLSPLMREIGKYGGHNVAVGVDTRTRGFSAEDLVTHIDQLRDEGHSHLSLLFMECDEAVLQSRFVETRRRHPLASDRPVVDGIRLEQRLLSKLKTKSDFLIDSTLLALPDLRRILIGMFSLQDQTPLHTSFVSFSFKKGVPREADLVFDMRFLQNPHYIEELRVKTGQDSEVAGYIAKDSAYEPFMVQLENMLDLLLPRYVVEGKSYLTIAIGCTGGKHRSVCVAEKIHDRMKGRGYFTHLVHRDMIKSGG